MNAMPFSKPDMSYLHAFNDAGGRPDERRGSRGSFTPGVRIRSGGQARDVLLEANHVDRGKLLFISSTLKPDLSGEPCTNVIGGRPDERLGRRGRFTPGARTFLGGPPRDVPLDVGHNNRGKVLFVSSILKPDVSGEARTNAIRPTERLGSQGSFTPGVRIMSGGLRRDVLPGVEQTDRGTVLFVSSIHKPDMSGEARTNTIGGRPTERFGVQGSFTPGRGHRWLGGKPRDIPLAADEIDRGTVLFVSSNHAPDLSGEARTNVVGGRPTERLGLRGTFTPGERCWLGGPPRNVPAEREIRDHGTVLFSRPAVTEAATVDTVGDATTHEGKVVEPEKREEMTAYTGFVETEVVDGCQPFHAIYKEDMAAFESTEHIDDTCSSSSSSSSGNGAASVTKDNGGAFRRCGSDSEMSTESSLTFEGHRAGF